MKGEKATERGICRERRERAYLPEHWPVTRIDWCESLTGPRRYCRDCDQFEPVVDVPEAEAMTNLTFREAPTRWKVLCVAVWLIGIAVCWYGISKLVSVIHAYEVTVKAEDKEIRAFLTETEGAVGEVWIRRFCRSRCSIDDLSYDLEVGFVRWRNKHKTEAKP